MEEWIDIEGYEGCYQVSNLGRIKSLTRRVRGKDCHKDGKNNVNERIMSTSLRNKKRYCNTVLCKEGKRKTFKVHRLVALAFVGGKSEDRWQINHIDGDKHNNRSDNLEWCTPSENTRHHLATFTNIYKLPPNVL